MSRPGGIWRGGECLWPQARKADDFLARAWGLLGKRGLEEEQALWLSPCSSIHMWGMRIPLDLIWLDAQDRVVAVQTDIRPWRWAFPGRRSGACAVIEAASHSIVRLKIQPGQALTWQDAHATEAGDSAAENRNPNLGYHTEDRVAIRMIRIRSG
ncbi:DUF192 domain-containing protein [Acidithiobacillus sp.]|uniref:DUF192 domain-containing protein n=1 Tax=Acidithiobacillus sp. TaxID=1872118 RepID=UPI0025C4EF21|nr:DUF192 domain-containing protein [Acidithiobacillus sp.]